MVPGETLAEQRTLNRTLLLIVNPVAGRKQALRLLADIVRVFMDAGYAVTVMTTGAPRDATALVRQYGADYDAVVCIGGDGTLSETVAGVLQSGAETPLGYIPAGSTNVFATSHGLSCDILAAARNIAAGGVKRIDAGWFNQRSFSFIAAFGAFSWSSYTTPQNLKNMLGSPAYILDGMMNLPKIKPIHIRIDAGKETHEGEYLFGAVCNLFSFPGLLKLPEGKVRTDDGLFEVILIREPGSLLEWQAAINSVLSGKFDSGVIEFFQAGEMTIRSNETVAWALDGEYEGSGSGETIHVRNQNRAIRLLAGKGG
ncbi:MAG: YegS/Rv2252/BmrU family lipid kinase [Clostridiales bacterium]|nr:YegS/Rv2252/BmrU family lipid kinase [Clostridiales bacterium]